MVIEKPVHLFLSILIEYINADFLAEFFCIEKF